jgi:hypothetical protein
MKEGGEDEEVKQPVLRACAGKHLMPIRPAQAQMFSTKRV